MSLSNGSEGMVMPVAPMYGGNGYGNGFGGDGWWVILFLFALMGNGGWGGFGAGNNQMAIWPYFTAQNTDAGVQRGFDTAALTSQLSGIQTSVTNGFSNAEVAACNRATNQLQADYSNQIASMQQNFANQQALQQNLFGMQQAQSQCCCENRLATCQTQNIIQNEGNQTRFADANNTRDLLTNQTANTQAILDKLCQLELDGVKAQVEAKNDKISDLERQLTMANLAASQVAQTGRLLADNAAQTQALEQYLNPVPIPAYVVQNPNCCQQNAGCGCGF